MLQWQRDGGWQDLYAIEPGEPDAIDFEMANWYTSTWPESGFVQTMTAQRATPEARYTLRNLTFIEDSRRRDASRGRCAATRSSRCCAGCSAWTSRTAPPSAPLIPARSWWPPGGAQPSVRSSNCERSSRSCQAVVSRDTPSRTEVIV